MFDYSQDKAKMVATRYRKEQNETRLAGIEACKDKNLVVECYAGGGGLTEVYKQYFQEIVNNDINPQSPAQHHMKAMDFIQEVVHDLEQKISMVDLDCYGSPAFEIQEFFKCARYHAPFVLTLSDGFGVWLKRSKKEKPIRSRYLIDGTIDYHRIWERHIDLVDNLIKVLCEDARLSWERIAYVQTKSKNYVLATYTINHIT